MPALRRTHALKEIARVPIPYSATTATHARRMSALVHLGVRLPQTHSPATTAIFARRATNVRRAVASRAQHWSATIKIPAPRIHVFRAQDANSCPTRTLATMATSARRTTIAPLAPARPVRKSIAMTARCAHRRIASPLWGAKPSTYPLPATMEICVRKGTPAATEPAHLELPFPATIKIPVLRMPAFRNKGANTFL